MTTLKNTTGTKYYNAKSVTVFHSKGYGRFARTSPRTFKNVLVEITGNNAIIYSINENFLYLEKTTKKTTSKYWEIEAREITKTTFKKNLKKLETKIKDLLSFKDLESVQNLEHGGEAVRNAELEAFERIPQRIEKIRNLLKELDTICILNKKEWHEKADQIVGTVGFDLVRPLGWKSVLELAKNAVA